MTPASIGLAGNTAIIGVGATDYPHDWRRIRAGEQYSDAYGYAQAAFTQALRDAGLRKDDIDGLVVKVDVGPLEVTRLILTLTP